MIGVVVVTHGQLATELLNAAETIVGDLPRFAAVVDRLARGHGRRAAKIAQAIARVAQGRGVLILTDMFGGTPSNLAMTLPRRGTVEVITGVNLPMLIKLADLGGARGSADRGARDAGAGPERLSGWRRTCCAARKTGEQA